MEATSLLRAVVRVDGPHVTRHGDFFVLQASALTPVCRCCSKVALSIGGDRFSVSAYPIYRGETVVTKRPGRRDHRQTFDAGDALVIECPIPAAHPALRRLRGNPASLSVDLLPSFGIWREGPSGREFHAESIKILGVELATADEPANCEVSVID